MEQTIRRLVFLLFFTSGLASLVLETVWVRMMVLVFGSTTFALSTVLTAFMGGLALGSWLAGRRAERFADPCRALWVYGLLELAIGCYALVLPHLVDRIHLVHAALWGGVSSSYYTFALLRFLLAGALLILPTVAMGATLPLLARFFCADEPSEATGEKVGSLYAANTTGAVFGVFLAGFILLPRVGIRATNLVACLADLVLGASALLLARKAITARPGQGASSEVRAGRATEPPRATRVSAPATASSPNQPTWLPALAMWSIAVSGALAMVYQVAWTRAMSLIIGSSTYAFSLILICFLVGLAGGAWLYSLRQARQADQAANLSVIHLLVALTALAGILFMDHLPVVLVTLMRRVELSPATVFLLKFLVAGTVILLPTFFMGMVFPAVIRICSSGAGAARTTGNVYGMNTLGSIVGSFAGGFLLVPLIGLQQSLVLMVILGLLLAAVFGLMASRRMARGILAAVAVGGALVALLLVRPWNLEVMTAGVFRLSRYEVLLGSGARDDGSTPHDERRERRIRRRIPPTRVVDTMQEPPAGYSVVYHHEGVTTTVSMARTVEESLSDAACWVRHSLLVNGKPDASLSVLHPRPRGEACRALLARRLGPGIAISPSGDAETQILSGLLPVLLYPGDTPPRQVLVIGWGSGITVGAALQAPVERVVAVELEQAVVEAASYFEPHNHTPLRDRRLQLVNEDGRNYLAVNPQQYDVVVSEPSNPWIAGCGNLFTHEFFQLVHRRLGPDGVYLQWLQAYEIAPQNVWSILGTLRDVFPSTYVFRPVQSSADLLIVARKAHGKPSWATIAERMALPGVGRELARVKIEHPADLVARLLAGPDQVRRTTAGVSWNTDDNARIEFATPKDLINYQRYSSSTITRPLAATLSERRGLLVDEPSDATLQLCRAALRAGHAAEAIELGQGQQKRGASPGVWDERANQTPGLAGYLEGAATLLAPLPELEPAALDALGLAHLARKPPRQAIGLLLKERAPNPAVLGHLYALAERPFSALVYLLEARRRGPRYEPLARVLASVYFDRGRFDEALRLVLGEASSKP